MEKYLNAPIKEIITTFPQVGKILEEYNIGCVPCTLGSCLLKDVVAIHNLPREQEVEMMYRIEKVIYPDRDIKKPTFKIVSKKQSSNQIRYSPPIKRLVDEHALIKKWLEMIPAVLEKIDIKSKTGRQFILDGLDFIRSYADKFHHAKEEDILFDYTDKKLDIIKTILADHETARGHVKAILGALDKNDTKIVGEHLNAYKELLAEHIKKEDEVLYPWIDRGLSTAQVGELFAKFDEAEGKINKEVIAKCRRFAEEAEGRIKKIQKLKNPSTSSGFYPERSRTKRSRGIKKEATK